MFDDIVRSFLGSGAEDAAAQEVAAKQGLDPARARAAVRATAEGSTEVLSGLDPGAILASVGGGALGKIASSLGLGGASGATGGLPHGIERQLAAVVAERTGLSPAVASAVVAVVLPKVLAFAKDTFGGEEAHTNP